MYKASDMRTKGKEIFDLAATQPVLIERAGKRYVLSAYDTERSLKQMAATLAEHEAAIAQLKQQRGAGTNWGA